MDLLNIIFILYFALHIPTTLLIDSQSVLPAHLFPKQLTDLLQWHIKTNNDHLVQTNPAWFKAVVYCELALQLPFFFVAVYALATQRKWIRIPALIYGVHTATTLIPILGDILFGPNSGPHSLALAGIYVPYFIIPALLAWRMAAKADPFAGSSKRKKQKAK